MALLEPAVLARLERLQLATRRPLAGHLAGEHRSPAFGTSVDFADYREYSPGDDVRRIDHALYARLDVLLVRLFEAEDDLSIRILVDTSGSMAHGGKLDQAKRLAAALGFVALTRRDSMTVHRFPFERPAPRFRGRAAVPALFAHLDGLSAAGSTELVAAATNLLARPGRPGLSILISDLLTPQWAEGLRRLPARGGDVIVAHVLAVDDLRPIEADTEIAGDVELVDAETGARVMVSASRAILEAFERRATAWADEVAARCRQQDAAYVRVFAHDDVATLLFGAWRAAGALR